MHESPVYRKILSAELERRSAQNPRLSLRSFARAFGVDSASLAQILKGTRVPSVKVATRLCQALGLAPGDAREFMLSVAQMKAGNQRVSPQLRALLADQQHRDTLAQDFRPRDLTPDVFRSIADWYHAAILELTFVEGFRSQPRWIARRLKLPVPVVRSAVARLLELGFLEEAATGEWKKTGQHLATVDKTVTTAAFKRRQTEVLEKSREALLHTPIEERVHQAMTMAIDPARMGEARARIQNFLRELCLELEQGPRKEVYECQISLFPLSQKETL